MKLLVISLVLLTTSYNLSAMEEPSCIDTKYLRFGSCFQYHLLHHRLQLLERARVCNGLRNKLSPSEVEKCNQLKKIKNGIDKVAAECLQNSETAEVTTHGYNCYMAGKRIEMLARDRCGVKEWIKGIKEHQEQYMHDCVEEKKEAMRLLLDWRKIRASLPKESFPKVDAKS